MSTEYQSADLIMKLYDLRREETMRKARDWFFLFSPESVRDLYDAVNGPDSAYYRMVTSYWDMAASFVNHGAIDEQMFNDANLEHVAVFSKLEPFIEEVRNVSKNPQYLHNLEKLVMRLPEARERMRNVRERIRQMAAARAANAEKAGD